MKKLVACCILMLAYCGVHAQVSDTLGWEKFNQGTETLYESPNGGYAFGNNGYGDKAKAQSFSNDQAFVLKKALLKFGAVEYVSQDLNSAVLVNVYLNNGPGVTITSNSDTVAPDSVIATVRLPVYQILENVITEVDFSSETLVFSPEQRFSIGVVLDSLAVGDTIGLLSTTDEDASGTQNAWELTTNNDWMVVAQPEYSWNLDIDLGIFAVIDENDPAGVTKTFSEATFNLFPNPATNRVSIEVQGGLSHRSSFVQILDVNGRAVLSEASMSSNLIEVDISSLQSGIYMISVFNELGVSSTRFVKQ